MHSRLARHCRHPGRRLAVNYSLFPAWYAQWCYTGDVFRFAFSRPARRLPAGDLVVLERAVSRRRAGKRRRMARDLRDGLAQELAYISGNMDSAAEDGGEVAMRRLRAGWSGPRPNCGQPSAACPTGRQAVGAALAQAASQTAERFRIALDLDIVPDPAVAHTGRPGLWASNSSPPRRLSWSLMFQFVGQGS